MRHDLIDRRRRTLNGRNEDGVVQALLRDRQTKPILLNVKSNPGREQIRLSLSWIGTWIVLCSGIVSSKVSSWLSLDSFFQENKVCFKHSPHSTTHHGG